jgi:hypothetical protein
VAGRSGYGIPAQGEAHMNLRCHKEKGVLVPGCMGGAVYGKSGCTCDTPSQQRDELARELASLHRRVLALERLAYSKDQR